MKNLIAMSFFSRYVLRSLAGRAGGARSGALGPVFCAGDLVKTDGLRLTHRIVQFAQEQTERWWGPSHGMPPEGKNLGGFLKTFQTQELAIQTFNILNWDSSESVLQTSPDAGLTPSRTS